MVDTVAQCLSEVKEQLDKVNVKYVISITTPTRSLSDLDENNLYVIRQQIHVDGVYQLIVGAKMAKAKE